MARRGSMTSWIAGAMILLAAAPAPAQDAAAAPDVVAQRQQAMDAMQAGDLDAAAALWDALIALDPAAPVYRYNLACTRARQGDSEAAIAALRAAVDAGFANGSILAVDPDLDSIRDHKDFAGLVDGVSAVDPIHQMDFWVGSWDVFGTDGKLVGENIIEVRNKGRLVFEQWKDTNGWVGCSQNFYDAGLGSWRQLWTDEAGGVVEYTGTREGDEMRFEGTQLDRTGARVGSRMVLTINEDGSVRQVIDQQQPDGSWATAVDFRYVKRAG